MNKLNKIESGIFFVFGMFLASRGSSFRIYFIFTAAGDMLCGGRKTSPRTSSECGRYTFLVLWDNLAYSESL